MIEIKFGNDSIMPVLRGLLRGGQDLSPLMTKLAGIMLNAVEDNFEQSGRPAWQKLQNPGPKRQGGKILIASARLKNSITPFSDAKQATVGTNVKYAAIHQFGGITKPHIIRARDKKALAFGGRVFKSVKHPGSNIPARPFLQLTPEDESRIIRRVENYLKALVEKSAAGGSSETR